MTTKTYVISSKGLHKVPNWLGSLYFKLGGTVFVESEWEEEQA